MSTSNDLVKIAKSLAVSFPEDAAMEDAELKVWVRENLIPKDSKIVFDGINFNYVSLESGIPVFIEVPGGLQFAAARMYK